jgi:Domain of unknown function (DUF4203)
MRIPKALLWICACAVVHVSSTEAEPTAIARRQANQVTTTPAAPSNTATEAPLAATSNESLTTTTTTTTTDLSNAGSPSASGSESEKSTADASDAASLNPSSTGGNPTSTDARPSITSAINGPAPTPSTSASNADESIPDPLPLQPKITPALAIAGVFLILAGLTYTLIGIKSKWVLVFLSSAFLTSLSVTVLIIYVMNPPVRPAVQGAYFIAAFMTGVIFGAGSLVFKEVTEGLGCLLGGFCLSMWLLTLRPGGTLQSTGGKVILIAAFTVATYALSFSHYTRPYGLIGATSFAGATAAVLGFDCFSKAGLKEFWLYIWNLNDNLFPLNTNTYPITRGMRVELAVIVLMCLLGVVSQLKLWRVIKDRREKKNAIRLGDERERDQMEEAIGRRLEEGTERERAQWEADYGDPDDGKRNTQTDSGLGTEENNSVRKASVSVKEVEEGDCSAVVFESKETTPAINEQAKGGLGVATATITAVTGDAGESSNNTTHEVQLYPEPAIVGSQKAVKSPRDSSSAPMAVSPSAPEPFYSSPPIVPLPFTIPSAEAPQRVADGAGSTFAGTEPVSPVLAKRLSDRADNQGLSGNRERTDPEISSVEAVDFPCAAHSKASSLAATIDDNIEELSQSRHGETCPSSRPESVAEALTVPGTASVRPEEARETSNFGVGAPTTPALSVADDHDPEEFQRPVQAASQPKAVEPASSSNYDHDGLEASMPSSYSRPSASQSQVEGNQAQDLVPRTNRRQSLDALSSTGSLTKGALERVPSQLSHVLMSYRTNEWAKHISTANEPEFDGPEAIPEGVEEELPTHLAERPARVEVKKLQQIPAALVSSPPPSQRQTSTIPSSLPSEVNRTFSYESNVSNSHLPSGRASWDSTTQPDVSQVWNSQLRQETASSAGLSRSASVTSLPLPITTRGLRSTSTPVPGQSLMTSPIDENAEVEFLPPTRPSISPLPSAGASLLAQRDSLLRSRHSQLTARNTGSPTEMLYSQPPVRSTSRLSLIDEAGSRSTSRLSNFEDGDPILPSRSASRFSLPIMNEDDMTLSQRRAMIQQQSVAFLPENRLAATDNFDAHLPQRNSSAVTAQKRESMLAFWRQSMRQEVALTAVPKETVESRRADMMMEKQQSKMNQQHSEVTKIHQENAFDQAMRRGDMQELHKEAMRRMQANANKHVS